MLSITFKYSRPFQSSIVNKDSMPDIDEVKKSISSLKKFWSESEEDVCRTLQEITGLSYKGDSITCYINTEFSVSDPLCLKIQEIDKMKKTLIHELIHVLFTQNYECGNEEFIKKWDAYRASYPEESFLTRAHIALHSTQHLLTQKLFPDHIKDLEYDSKKEDYIRSWDIVLEETPEKIVEMIKV